MKNSVLQIDHIELFVPDRYEAAAWYQRVLGLQIVADYEHWAANPAGPLMISGDGGVTKLALFEGQPQGTRVTAGFDRVAFRVTAIVFVEYLRKLVKLGVTDRGGETIAPRDHQAAYSIYFSDPYGHHLEITTYEHEATRALLTTEQS